ncbi:hypothetical protein [Streptomyces sp. NPDC047042]|uniref:hypothetical protein n=1 Tax=Streptomyces sp. NPDC047042 TaxID=3154807 RepID=UPI0033D8E0C2
MNTVAEIMAGLGLQGRKPPRRRRSLTRQGKRRAAPDLVHRRFDAVAPDLLRYGDMTEIATREGKIYLATVIDAFSRRCLGYAMGEQHLLCSPVKSALPISHSPVHRLCAMSRIHPQGFSTVHSPTPVNAWAVHSNGFT